MNVCARPAEKPGLAPILSSAFIRQHDVLVAFDQDIGWYQSATKSLHTVAVSAWRLTEKSSAMHKGGGLLIP